MRDDQATTYTLERDGLPPLRFDGVLLAESGTSPDRARRDWSGATGRWSELRLYRTRAGKYVCEVVSRTQWQGERDAHRVETCDTPEEVTEVFGWDLAARELYEEAGFDIVETLA